MARSANSAAPGASTAARRASKIQAIPNQDDRPHGLRRAIVPESAGPHTANHGRGQRRLGQTKTVHHLAGREPAVMRESLLRDIRQNGVGAAESDDGRLAEEEAFLEKRMTRP